MIDPPRHVVGVSAAIVDDEGRVLVVQRRDDGRWEPPGGMLELDETIEAGLRREVREETGLEITAEALTGAYKNLRIGTVALVFRCRVAGGRLTTSDETAAFRWLRPDAVGSHMVEAFGIRLLDALAGGPPRVRAHDGVSLVG